MNADEIFEDLPPKLRKQVLRHWAGEDEEPQPEPQSGAGYVVRAKWWHLLLAFLWSIPFLVVGLALTATIIFAPIGIPIMVVGAKPLAKLLTPKELQS